MKKWIFVCAVALLPFAINAQQYTDYEDVVYLKNGSIYRGIIIEQIPNETLKIESKDRNVFAVKFSEVEKITKEEKTNSFYRNGYYSQGIDGKPHFDEIRPKREYKPTKLNGFYMNWGMGFGGSPDNFGFILNMDLGGKIFPKKKLANTEKRVVIGGDVFGNIGGMFGFSASFMTGVYGGPTIGIKLRRGNIYLTPYTGFSFNTGRYNDYITYYDSNGSYLRTDYLYSSFINASLPVGFKFEYNYNHFICGANTNLGFDITGGAAGKLLGFVGVKF